MKRVLPLLLSALGGAALALALPLVVPALSLREIDPAGHLEWLAWVALVPVISAVDRAATARRAFALGLLAGLAYFFAAIYWVAHAMTAFGGLSNGLALLGLTLLVLYMAAHWGGAFAVSWVVRRRLGWPWALHLPWIWAAAELTRNYLFSGFPWANLGYVQARHLVVSQLASLFGVYAIAALVVLVNCAVFEAFRARRERRPFPVRLTGAIAAVVALAVGYGEAHLASVRARVALSPKLKVGLVQGNIDQSVKNDAANNATFILGRYLPLTLEADRAGADLVAWPEVTYPYVVSPQITSFAGERARLAPLHHAYLLLGAATVEWKRGPAARRLPEISNSVFLLRPDLSVSRRYVKHHLVPFGEYVPLGEYLPFIRQVVPDLAPTSPGRELVTLELPVAASARPATAGSARLASLAPVAAPAAAPRTDTVRFAPMICFDAIFPEINLAYAKQDPEFLVNPTNDAWYGYSSGPYQFLAIVRLRAIEAGKAVARPAYSGVTAIVLPTGEIAPGALELGPVDPDLAPDPRQPPQLLLGELPRLRGRTLYTSIGDLFAYACAVFTAVAIAAAVAQRRRGESA